MRLVIVAGVVAGDWTEAKLSFHGDTIDGAKFQPASVYYVSNKKLALSIGTDRQSIL